LDKQLKKTLGVDDVCVKRSRRAKYLRISIGSDQAVVVTVPHNLTLAKAHELLVSKKQWILKQLQKIRERKNALEEVDINKIDLNAEQDRLFSRLDYFSNMYKLPYRRASFKCQKTIWGSCSGKDNLNLNVNMCLLPRHLQDYILLHELCHIRHKNHSKQFWSQLDQYTDGKAKQLRNELKKYSPRLRI